jgi:polar amino acid transport system substrate-binding protein
MIPRIATSVLFLGLTLAVPGTRALTLVTEENPPFNYIEHGKVVGLSTDVVTELGKRSGIPLQIKSMPWEQAYVAAQRDKETCVYSTARLDNREHIFSWVGPIATNRWVLIGKSDFAGLDKVEDARKYRVGVVAKDAKIEFLMARGVTDLREVSEDALNPPRLVLSRDDPNRIDLWATSAYGARRTAARSNVKDLKVVLPLQQVPLYLACGRNKTSAQTVHALSQALERAKNDGTLKRITQQYAF